MGGRHFVYATRGLYLLIAQGAILWLKHLAGVSVAPELYLALLGAIAIAQVFRTWAAGFVGRTAGGRETRAAVLLTAGPYAHLRNPMYLGNLLITTSLAMMSGLWFAPLIAWAAFAFVYALVIPFEEAFLQERFGEEYEEYRRAVPRLLPTRRGYPLRRGGFLLREGLLNEVPSWVVLPVFCYLFWVL